MRILAIVIALAACGKGDEPPPPTSGSPNSHTESGPSRPRAMPTKAQAVFHALCATCHGPDGRGTGPSAQMLNPKPRDYTDPKWQASVTDAEIKDVILKGGAALGKSPSMASFA